MVLLQKGGIAYKTVGWTCVALFILVWTLWTCVLTGTVFLLYPAMLLFLGGKEAQRICVHIADFFWGNLVTTMEVYCNGKVKISGDPLPLRENVIAIANHRWFIDWLMVFSVAIRLGR